jgi:hypothetical protein
VSPSAPLQTLNAPGNPNLAGATLELPALEVLNLSGCRALASLRLRCPRLRSLNLSGCPALRELVVEGPTALQHFNVAQCRDLAPAAFERLACSAGAALETVTATGCWLLAAPYLQRVLARCPRLHALDVAGCRALESEAAAEIAADLALRARR